MLKTVGLLMILTGSAGVGFSKSFELSHRLKMLEGILQFVILLRGEIRCKSASLPDAFLGMEHKLPGMFEEFLRTAAQEMEKRTGETFGEIFERCALQFLPVFRLEAEERGRFLSFGSRLGYLDGDMQMRQLDLYELELKHSIEKLRLEMPAKKKMYQSMGVLGGILLAILVY